MRPRWLRACFGCSGRTSRAVSRLDDCAGPPRAVRQRLSPARSRRPPRASARRPWPGCWRWSWPRCCSTLVTGRAWPPAAASGRGLKTRCVTRSAGLRRKGGGCGTRSNVAGAGISTASRLPRPESGSLSFSAPVFVIASALRCAICSGRRRVLCPGVCPPGLLHSRGGVQSSAGGVAGWSGVLDGARRGLRGRRVVRWVLAVAAPGERACGEHDAAVRVGARGVG